MATAKVKDHTILFSRLTVLIESQDPGPAPRWTTYPEGAKDRGTSNKRGMGKAGWALRSVRYDPASIPESFASLAGHCEDNLLGGLWGHETMSSAPHDSFHWAWMAAARLAAVELPAGHPLRPRMMALTGAVCRGALAVCYAVRTPDGQVLSAATRVGSDHTGRGTAWSTPHAGTATQCLQAWLALPYVLPKTEKTLVPPAKAIRQLLARQDDLGAGDLRKAILATRRGTLLGAETSALAALIQANLPYLALPLRVRRGPLGHLAEFEQPPDFDNTVRWLMPASRVLVTHGRPKSGSRYHLTQSHPIRWQKRWDKEAQTEPSTWPQGWGEPQVAYQTPQKARALPKTAPKEEKTSMRKDLGQVLAEVFGARRCIFIGRPQGQVVTAFDWRIPAGPGLAANEKRWGAPGADNVSGAAATHRTIVGGELDGLIAAHPEWGLPEDYKSTQTDVADLELVSKDGRVTLYDAEILGLYKALTPQEPTPTPTPKPKPEPEPTPTPAPDLADALRRITALEAEVKRLRPYEEVITALSKLI